MERGPGFGPAAQNTMETSVPDPDTDQHREREPFPSTPWTTILQSEETSRPDRITALNELATQYWKPIYAYFRTRWAKTIEDAKDLTQDFFLHLLDSPLLSSADPERGRFRTYLKVALDRYVISDDRKRRSLKRGGDRWTHSFEEIIRKSREAELPDPKSTSPEEALDKVWKSELLKNAAALLEQRLVEEGKKTYALLFRDYYLAGDASIDYAQLSLQYGISTADLSNYLLHAKRRFRAILKDLVARTVSSPGELELELNALFGDKSE